MDALTNRDRFRLDASTNDYGDIVGLLTKQAKICQLTKEIIPLCKEQDARIERTCRVHVTLPPVSLHMYLFERGVCVTLGLVGDNSADARRS